MKKETIILLFYFFILFSLSIYSYALLDPNLTLINSSLWAIFRNKMITLGYFKREISSYIYLSFTAILFLFHFYFVKNSEKYNPTKLAIIVITSTLFSYPFLSHDFFNYLFDAKILTFYHKNPYNYSGLDFPTDPWLRFMHWTHRKYPYGPSFLLITLIPSFFSFGKFSLSFFLTKLLFASIFFAAIVLLSKTDYKTPIFLISHPIIIVEGLINSHNDFVAVSLALLGIILLLKKKRLESFIMFLLSGLIKYISLPTILLSLPRKKFTKELSLILTTILIGVASLKGEVQPWYFLNLLVFFPFFGQLIKRLSLFFIALLLSYYPYVRYSQWNLRSSVELKHKIILIGLGIQALFFLTIYLQKCLRWKRIKS